jgi:hypothetical protein
MSAIITDQFRILNSENLVNSIGSTDSAYYTFVGLTNAEDYDSNWDSSPPTPIDSFNNFDDVWDTVIALKKINKTNDVRRVVRKIQWTSGTTYDMYRSDVSRNSKSIPSGQTNLYSSNFYVINSEFRVYICLNNGINPENNTGRPSLDEPTFTDLEPRTPGDSGDGYVWKYLYTIKPSEVVKFDTLNYIPVPLDWNATEYDAIRENAETSGQLKVVTIKNRGSGLGAPRTYTNVNIIGDGTGAKATVVVGEDSTVESVNITSGGSGYTYGSLDLLSGGLVLSSGSVAPVFNVVIPPPGGHGSDIYRELGAYNVLIYSRIENDPLNPDFVVGNKIARVGIVKNPTKFSSSQLGTDDKYSAVYAIKLVGSTNINDYQNATFANNQEIFQTIGTGVTAVGRVVYYDNTTGVLKYWQDRTLVGFSTATLDLSSTSPDYGYNLNRFTSSPSSGGSLEVRGGSVNLVIDKSFSGITTVLNNNTTYNLGQNFDSGVSNPEVQKYSGDIIYIDNRPSIIRSANQKEDIKVILQF